MCWPVQTVTSASEFLDAMILEFKFREGINPEMSSSADSYGIQGRDFCKPVVVSVIAVSRTSLSEYEQSASSVICDHGRIHAGIVVQGTAHADGGEFVADSCTGPHGFFCDDIDCSSDCRSSEQGRTASTHHFHTVYH